MALVTSLTSGAEDPRFLQSVKNHPRYHLRLTAIIAVAFGLVFNILAVAIAHQFKLSGLAFLPLCISMVWNHVDLASKRLFTKYLPAWSLLVVDALGFLSFLALLIANGIIASKVRWWGASNAVLLTYTSVPWIFCCAVHGAILLQTASKMIRTRSSSSWCPNCRRNWDTTPSDDRDQANCIRTVSEYDPNDDRAASPAERETGEEHKQPPEMRESNDTTDETSRLMYQSA